MDVGTRREELQQLVECGPEACFEAFLRDVWVGGGGLGPFGPITTRILEKGDPVTGEGSIRIVPGGIQEEILAASRGQFIEYHVAKGPFPVSYHRGRVEFVAVSSTDSSASTMVTWSCSYTPFFLLGPVLGVVIRNGFSIMLRHLATCVQCQAETPSLEK
ncbi:unnamed protein product [Polarella glacialis]|uniref:Polyketide cyclase / dehydrase and lipid transport n=1 Tax=Polarella glacialis TaxID=89957 RepID=A0A813I3R4_POLGL|nr:unnamed protein product [Polarella glacialis]